METAASLMGTLCLPNSTEETSEASDAMSNLGTSCLNKVACLACVWGFPYYNNKDEIHSHVGGRVRPFKKDLIWLGKMAQWAKMLGTQAW